MSAENCSSAIDSVVEETSSSEPETENGGVRTILNTLKSPAPSQLARKRKIHSNPPTGVKRRTTTVKADYEPKSVTPTSRAREFPGNCYPICGQVPRRVFFVNAKCSQYSHSMMIERNFVQVTPG